MHQLSKKAQQNLRPALEQETRAAHWGTARSLYGASWIGVLAFGLVGPVALATIGCGGGSSFQGGASGTSSTSSASGTTGGGSGTSSSQSGTASTGASTTTMTPGSCANPTVQIDFSPMYSAFIPGDTMHLNFQIPAVTDDGNTATWSASDSTQVQLAAQNFGTQPGVMITVEGVGTGTTGQVTIYATEANGSCGASVLNITTSTDDDWTIGEARYNDGVSLTTMGGMGARLFDGGFPGCAGGFPGFDGGPGGPGGGGLRTSDGGSYYERDGGTACTNCHGVTATTGPYRDVSHTPEQTGGFSDQDLITIITQGIIPDGGYFDPSVIIASCDAGGACVQTAYETWHSFHQWTDITPDQYPGIVVYLRSLTPVQQNGSAANFGMGGRRRRDGGAPPPMGMPDASDE